MDNATDKTPRTKGFGKKIGQSGTYIASGMIVGEEYNADLRGYTGLRKFDQMRRSDSTIHAILQMCKLPLLGLDWTVVPASKDESDVFWANHCENELKKRNIDWNQFLSEALTELDFGFSVIEKTYELTEFEGKTVIGLTELGYRKQTTIRYWDMHSADKPGVTQQLQGGGSNEIPEVKLMKFTFQKEGDNHEGISLLRFAYKDWYMKDYLTKVNGVALERLGTGVPVITFDEGTSPADRQRAIEAAENLRANESAYLEVPRGSTIEMLDMKGSTTKDVLPSIKHHDIQIALSVLGQFLMQGTTETGSRATSADHSKLFLLSEEALANQIQSVIQNQLIKQMIDLNTSELPNGYPQLQHSRIDDEDPTAFASAIQSVLSASGLTMNFDTEQAIRQTLHLPALEEDYRDDYEEKRNASRDAITNPPTAEADPKPKTPAKEDTKDLQPTKASVLGDMKTVRRILVKHLED